MAFREIDSHYQDVVKDTPHTFLFYHRITSDSNRRPDAGISAYLLCSSGSSKATTLIVISALVQKLYPFRCPHVFTYPLSSTFSLGDPVDWTPAMTVPTALLSAASDTDLFDVEREDGMEPLPSSYRRIPSSAAPFDSALPLASIFKGNVESKDGCYYGYLEVWLNPETFKTHTYLWRDDWVSL